MTIAATMTHNPIANKLKQSTLLAYLLAGVLIRPELGFRLITDHEMRPEVLA